MKRILYAAVALFFLPATLLLHGMRWLTFWRAFPYSCYAVPQVGEDAVRGTDQLGMTDLLRG